MSHENLLADNTNEYDVSVFPGQRCKFRDKVRGRRQMHVIISPLHVSIAKRIHFSGVMACSQPGSPKEKS